MDAKDEFRALDKKPESELTPLEAAVVYLYHKGGYGDDAMNAAAELARLRADIATLRDFSERYGGHLPNCPNPYKRECGCGFNQDRAALNESEPK